MPKKRLFLAIPIPQQLCTQLAAYTTSLNLPDSLPRRSLGEGRVRWINPANLHITLHFLGSVDQAHIAELIALLEIPISQLASFTLKFKQISFMPQKNPYRMVWAEYTNCDAYQEIFDVTKNVISFWGKKHAYRFNHDDNRSIMPHITLGRCAATTKCTHLPANPLMQPTISDLVVQTVQLMESLLPDLPTSQGYAGTRRQDEVYPEQGRREGQAMQTLTGPVYTVVKTFLLSSTSPKH